MSHSSVKQNGACRNRHTQTCPASYLTLDIILCEVQAHRVAVRRPCDFRSVPLAGLPPARHRARPPRRDRLHTPRCPLRPRGCRVNSSVCASAPSLSPPPSPFHVAAIGSSALRTASVFPAAARAVPPWVANAAASAPHS